MRYVFFGNNDLAVELLEWLVKEHGPPCALVVHPFSESRRRNDLIGEEE